VAYVTVLFPERDPTFSGTPAFPCIMQARPARLAHLARRGHHQPARPGAYWNSC
jgi:hypothetical protein